MQNKKLPAGGRGSDIDFLSKCAYCGSEFKADNLTVLEEEEQKTILHVICDKCRTAGIFFISNNQSGVLSLGMATDLDKEEVRQKFLQRAVSADEVIDAHRFVSGYKGNLDELVKKIS